MTATAYAGLDLLRTPPQYDRSQFVDRNDELQMVEQKIRTLQRDELLVEPIINFWGVKGIGKTWLLRHLQDTFSFDPQAAGQTTFAILYPFYEPPIRLDEVVRELAFSTLTQLDPKLTDVERADLERAAKSGRASTLVSAIHTLSKRFVPLILLDNAEVVGKADWERIEKELIEPIVSKNRVLLIVAGQRQVPRWKKFEVRRRLVEPDKSQVRPFNKAGITTLLEKREYQIPVDELYPYTAGSPLLVDVIARYILSCAEQTEVDKRWLESNRNKLLPALRAAEEDLLAGVEDKPRLHDAIATLAPLRFYRVEALQWMLERRSGATDYSEVDCYNTLLDLDEETDIVWWNRALRAYETSTIIRRVLNQRTFIEDRDGYIAQHRQAQTMYWEWAEKYRDASEDFLVEVVFHQASVYSATNDPNELQASIDKALEFARSYLTLDRFIILRRQIKGDDELLDQLPVKMRDYMLQTLEEFEDELTQTSRG